MEQFSLTGKNIIVTGASSGIGKQCAISCGAMGANVILLGRNQERLNEALADVREVSAGSDMHLTYSVELTDALKSETAVNEVVSRVGPINGLVNCAGVSTVLPLKAVSERKLTEYFYSNVFSAYNMTKIVTKSSNMHAAGGSIIFLTSVMGMVGESGRSLYGMTKAALTGACKSLAIEFAPRRIRVNCISPGVVATPMSEKSIYSKSPETLEGVRNLHPLGFGDPSDIANACIYLLSDASKWTTGVNLVVDGGYTAR